MTVSPQWNVRHEEDARYSLKWNRLMMRMLGIWSLVSDVSGPERITSVFLRVLFASSLCTTMVILGIFVFGGGNNIDEQMEMVGPLIYGLMSTLKYLCLVFRCKDIRRCVDTLRMDWRMVHSEEDRDLMLKLTRNSHILSKIPFVILYLALVLYHGMMPFFMNKDWRGPNSTSKPVPYRGFDDINIVPDPTIATLFVGLLQVSSGMTMINVTITVCSLAPTLVNHACGRFEMLINRLRSMMDDERGLIEYKERIGTIVEFHVDTLEFSSDVEKILRDVFLIEIVGSTLIICLLEYDCIVNWHNNESCVVLIAYATLLLSFVFTMLMYCCIGEWLTDQCLKVGDVCYDTEWYKVPARSALDFNLMIFMSQHPKKLTAGKIISISLISFTSVIKTSVAYLNLIRALIQ